MDIWLATANTRAPTFFGLGTNGMLQAFLMQGLSSAIISAENRTKVSEIEQHMANAFELYSQIQAISSMEACEDLCFQIRTGWEEAERKRAAQVAGVSLPILNGQGMPSGYEFKPEWEISPRDAASQLRSNSKTILIDCRTTTERSIVSIGGSLGLPIPEFERRISEIASHKENPVIVYCHNGNRSLQMAQSLRLRGFVNAKSLAGGIDLWAIDVEPGMKRYKTPTR